MDIAFRRVMLKLSGEALGKDGWLFDHEKIGAVAGVIRRMTDLHAQVGVVISGGNCGAAVWGVLRAWMRYPLI